MEDSYRMLYGNSLGHPRGRVRTASNFQRPYAVGKNAYRGPSRWLCDPRIDDAARAGGKYSYIDDRRETVYSPATTLCLLRVEDARPSVPPGVPPCQYHYVCSCYHPSTSTSDREEPAIGFVGRCTVPTE